MDVGERGEVCVINPKGDICEARLHPEWRPYDIFPNAVSSPDFRLSSFLRDHETHILGFMEEIGGGVVDHYLVLVRCFDGFFPAYPRVRVVDRSVGNLLFDALQEGGVRLAFDLHQGRGRRRRWFTWVRELSDRLVHELEIGQWLRCELFIELLNVAGCGFERDMRRRRHSV